MARTSRKAAAMEAAASSVAPERVYHAAAYVRLSVEDNKRCGDRESITMQQYMLEKYISGQPDMVLHGIYSDNGESGTDFERPGFERMMDSVRNREVDCIVVKDLSRFGRNYVETGYYLEKIFPYLGVRFVAVNDHYDTENAKDGNELVLSLKNLVNDLYAKDISQKIHSSLITKRKNGEFLGSFPPYGYLKSPEDKHKLVVDQEVASVVREIFQWRLAGDGLIQIARRLNDRGFESPSMYHYRKGHKKKKPEGAAAIWQAQIIKIMTANPVYAGHMAQGKTKESLCDGIAKKNVSRDDWVMVRNTHEALVSQETFDRIQEIAGERHQKSCALRGKYPSTENIFKGLIVCADCGTKMMRYKKVSPAGTVRYTFLCRIYAENLGGQGCTIKCIGEPELKEAVFLALRVQIDLALDLEQTLKRVQGQGSFQKKCRELSENIARVQKEAKRNTALRSSLFESYCDHTLTETEYLSMKAEYDRRAQELAAELKQLEAEKKKYTHDLSPQNEWIVSLKKYRKEKTITRKMAEELIQRITVSGYNEINITWNFQDEFARLMAHVESGVE